MAYKIEISSNALVITDTDTSKIVLDEKAKDIYYDHNQLNRTGSRVSLYGSASFYQLLTDCVDTDDNPFSISSFTNFAHVELGKSSGGGGGEGGQTAPEVEAQITARIGDTAENNAATNPLKLVNVVENKIQLDKRILTPNGETVGSFAVINSTGNNIEYLTKIAKRETILTTYSTADQAPTVQNTFFPFNYGNPSDIVTTEATLSSTGELTINQAGQYYLRVFGHFGRDNNQGNSKSLFFGQMNVGTGWFPIGVSKVFMISNSNDFQSFEFEVFFELSAGQQMRYGMVRDTTGNNSGGCYSFNPDFVGAPPFPSIGVDFSKLVIA